MRPPNVHPCVLRALTLVLWLVIAIAATWAGLNLRDWTWRTTAPIRFHGDIANAVRVGSQTFDPQSASPRADDPKRVDWWHVLKGYYGRYDLEADRVARDRRPTTHDDNYSFDYPPGRLLIVTLWTAPVFVERGVGTGYDDAFAGPMLAINTAHELAAALGVFAFVRLTFRRSGRGRFTSESAAMASALLCWFNPAGIMNSHGWPQWDVWVVPYTIWAAYFALANRWIMVGLLLATGAMFKGQVLLIAPLFALWPMFRLDGSALLRLFAGFAATVALLMSPWLLRASPAQIWSAGAIVLAIAPILCPRRWRFGSIWWVAVAALAGWTLGPWLHASPDRPMAWHAGLLVLALLPFERWRAVPLRAWNVPRVAIVAWLASAAPAWLLGSLAVRWPTWFALPASAIEGSTATLVAAVLLVAAVASLSAIWRGRRLMWLSIFIAGVVTLAAIQYDGSTAWWTVGFQTDRFHTLSMGATNLPAIFGSFYGLNVDSPVSLFGHLTPEKEWALRSLLRGIAFAGMGLAAAALALQQKRRDANLLIAIPAAWAMLFAFMPQMHERYLVWAALTSAMLVTRGVGGLLIYVALTTLQLAALYTTMCASNGGGAARLMNDGWFRAAAGLNPSGGWIAATLAIVLLVWSFRRSAPPKAAIAEPV